ncbi:hypothetical protein F2Q69_00018172 [Brassica cretica]|uniref:Zinc knuckle CX2CX4HX4C domain-containing protein n=1 Tax=Brassica cretica TaxID=69181 RepID=A0A8S9QLH1_BRACR|nr:hypothetical protein F2Q69_00018172 [Brassica cretica]
MVRDILLPSGDTKQVEFAYEKLEKHCFRCFSLSHEKDDCPLMGNDRGKSPKRLGISQNNTMARLDERRRKYEERRKEKTPQAPREQNYRSSSPLYAKRYDYPYHREDSRPPSRQHQSYAPVTSEYRRGREDNNTQGRHYSRNPISSARAGSRGILQASDHPSREVETRREVIKNPVARKDNMRTPSHDSGSKSIQSPALPTALLNSTDLRRSLSHREEAEKTNAPLYTPTSADRRPVRDRLSLPSNGKELLAPQGISTGSSRQQDIEIQYLEENLNPLLFGNDSMPSGSRPPGTTASPTGATSPIRTLSEDRRHVSLRLGPLPTSTPSPIQARLSDGPRIITRRSQPQEKKSHKNSKLP